MKITLFLISSFFFAGIQNLRAQSSPGIQLSNHIADKMKDSLGLTADQRYHIYTISLSLFNQKLAARQQFTNPDSIKRHLQLIEDGRDSLYHHFLPDNIYDVYLTKKKTLISSN